jgi:hypothetical protein
MSVKILIEGYTDHPLVMSDISAWNNVIGHVIAVVIKNPETGEISLERDIAVNADSFEDNELAEATVKTIERKLNEAFPDPNKQEPETKLWVPE